MKTIAFIDASNLFYGGEKSLGWKIDYQKLLDYLKNKYGASKAMYFGGVETYDFGHNYLAEDTVLIENLAKYLSDKIKDQGEKLSTANVILISRYLQKAKFYLKLKTFGYELHLKPVKLYYDYNEVAQIAETKRKANCDVDMAFYLMKEKDNFDRAVILSGDGDFLPVLKYLKSQNKEIIILARGPRAAREICQFAGSNFRDFVRLEKIIKFVEK